MNERKNATKYLLISLLLIIIDQGTKMLVHFKMEPGFPGQIVLISDWLKLHYVLNPGMAFGMQLGHEYGKLLLTLFRLVAMFVIGWYLVRLAVRGASGTLLLALSMILAGAVGNVIDSTFYGVLLGNAPVGSPTPWFHGQVIDMIFVDFWEGFLPEWIPVFGGQYYSTPIFNVADSCIFVGVCIVLIFQGHFYTPIENDTEGNVETDPEGGFKETDLQENNENQPVANNEAASERASDNDDTEGQTLPDRQA
ncbi:hypothetical protein GCM10023091_38810 [Ravibacter arvi]|uniref:Lipoprotein signal peptidase n=1 Tax=Ravibacter arvi TaxID=2051041 RepID=A0ABP8M863_9BACT